MFFKHSQIKSLNRAQKEFLTRYRNGFKIENGMEYWNQYLPDNLYKTQKLFENSDLIQEASLNMKMSVTYKITDLKRFLKEKGQKVSGNKPELIQSAIAFRNDVFVKNVEKEQIYCLTEKGNAIVSEYFDFQDNEKQQAEIETMKHLENRDYLSACMSVANYEAKQVIPRGMGIDWKKYNPQWHLPTIKLIFSEPPKIINGLPQKDLIHYQKASAMAYLWGVSDGSKWLPSEIKSSLKIDEKVIIRMIWFHAHNKHELDEFRNASYIKGVKILSADDSCEECKKISGKVFKVNNVPSIPHEKCTHEMGCRCCYLAEII